MSLRKGKLSENNKVFMRLALELANQNKGLTGLNPPVGCVVTSKDEIISYGKTDINGRPHACLLYTSPSPRDPTSSRMPSSA